MWKALKSALGLQPPDSPDVVAAKAKMAADHADPRKRFVWCALAVSADEKADPGHRVEYATTAIHNWYGMKTREELLGNLDFYLGGTGSTPAYDVFRGVFMARAGFGAAILAEEESWERSYRFLRKLKQVYPSWNHYGTEYVEGHLAYRRKKGDAEATLATIRANMLAHFGKVSRGLWTATPYETPV